MELKVEHKPFPEHKYNKVIKVFLIDQVLCHEYSFQYSLHCCTVPIVQYKDNKVIKVFLIDQILCHEHTFWYSVH
jgi:hypothetical protein